MRLGPSLLHFTGYGLLRLLGSTWRIQVDDRAGLTAKQGKLGPVIVLVWHNRLLPIPCFWNRELRHRKGAALVSRSKDGEIIAGILQLYSGTVVRGSSSRGGARALAELSRMLERAYDVYLTPDGPRGPKYSMQPGALWLSRSTGAPIVPVTLEFSSAWRAKSWDGFFIPKPFARISVILHEPHTVAATASDREIALETERLREMMVRHTIEL